VAINATNAASERESTYMVYRILPRFAALTAFLLATGSARGADDASDPTGHPRAQTQLGPGDDGHAGKPSAGLHGIDVSASTEIATYADSDHVYVFTPSIAGSLANVVAGWSVHARYLVDVVSAASADVVSTASPPFLEARQAGTFDAAYKPRTFGVAANGAVSVEPDYTSVVGGATITQELLGKNLTLLFGYSHMHDIAGRSGTPFSVFSRTLDRDAFKGGATIVVDRATVLAFVADVMVEYGDPSKPYRYVPLFAPSTAVPIGASISLVNQLRLSERALEQLPLTRDRFALTMRWAHRLHRSTMRFDERAYVDTWGLKSTMTDARWFFDLGPRVEVGPHTRFYAQTPVDFWQRAYVLQPGLTYPALRTGNRELGPLVNVTGGASFLAALGSDLLPRTWVLRLDFDMTSTQYLDDIYLTQRLSGVGSISLEGSF
jgi:hypothetical protein